MADSRPGISPLMLTCATCAPWVTNPAPEICGETARTPGKDSIKAMKLAAVGRFAAVVLDFCCTKRGAPASNRAGSSGSAWIDTWAMSPTVRDKINSANPPISADMKIKIKTPTATPKTNSPVCALDAVR